MIAGSRRLLLKILRKSRVPAIVFLIFLAVIFTAFRALTPWAKQYKGNIEQHLSLLLGQPVKIHDLETSWYWFHPVLKMDGITIADAQHHVIELKKLWLGINVFRSLWQLQIQPGVLYMEDVHLILHQTHNSWDLEGLNPSGSQVMRVDSSIALPVLEGLLAQQKMVIKHASVDLYLNDGTLFKLGDLNFTSVQSAGHYRLNGGARVLQKHPTDFNFVADLTIDAAHILQPSGHVYVSMQHMFPAQWQRFFPESTYVIQTGKANVELWFDLNSGKLSSVQSHVHAQPLAWKHHGDPSKHVFQSFSANLDWKNTKKGWQLSGDRVQVTLDGLVWPENSFSLEYQRAADIYRGFTKIVWLRPLFALDLPWSMDIANLLRWQPEGELHDLQWSCTKGQFDTILVRFDHLGWHATDEFPGVQDLSGVLAWQPTSGRLELDSENTTIIPKNTKPLTFKMVNAAWNWQRLSNGLRISMDRFVLRHPQLVMSAQGAVDQALSVNDRQVRVTAEFYAKDAASLLAYLPTDELKPKLAEWLMHDVTRIGTASGRLEINGKWANFPFDDHTGTFTVQGHVNGVDLLINKDWPVNNDIDADITVNQRHLDANVDHAILQGVPVLQANVGIDGIGLGQEVLLIHGRVQALAADMKAYVFASPLRRRLNKLSLLELQDPVDLDLSLDLPLYTARDQVYAKGSLSFDHNPGLIHGFAQDISVDQLSGVLQFNEHGLTDGRLTGTIASAPMSLTAESFTDPEPHTQINLQGTVTAEELRRTFEFPLSFLMHGPIKVDSGLTLYDNPAQPAYLNLSTSLAGMAIDLPAPYGKSADEQAPLVIKAVFYPEKNIDFSLSYKDTLSSVALFGPTKKGLVLRKGEIHVGTGSATLPATAGLRIAGKIPEFKADAWHKVFSQPQIDQNSFLDHISSVNLEVHHAWFLDNMYKDLSIKAQPITSNHWALDVQQRNITAQLHYYIKDNVITGHVQHLWLDKPQQTVKESHIKLTPANLPNLDLTIDLLKVGQIELGSLALKGHRTTDHWILEQAHLYTPEYALDAHGDWIMQGLKNKTNVVAKLQIQDLGKSLERLSITPAVHARQGQIDFEGAWTGGYNDFSLARCTGQMQVTFKKGRVSHLDPETEKKLGFGKLLSILSLQTIPRRLTLDFSDLSEEGYTFDVFKGSFLLKNGIMNTQDSYVDGPVAYAGMTGDLDLQRHLYDIDLRISPYIAASLPVVATIAGGPVAGIATWVASKIINTGMQKISGYTYKVTGPWTDPVVQQVSIDHKGVAHKKLTP